MRLSHPKLLSIAIVLGLLSATAMAAAAEPPTSIPASPAEIWKAIDREVAAIHSALATGNLSTVHQHAFAVRDLVRGLPAHSPALSAAALQTLKTESKFVDTLAVRLDEAGDANDKTGTESNLRKLEDILKTIRAE